MSELLQAVGYGAIVYMLFNVLISFGSRRPLYEWINPGRHYLPVLAFTMFGAAYTTLRIATGRYGETQSELLMHLVTDHEAMPEVIGAVSFVSFGLAVLVLAGFCWFTLPRSPKTFSPDPRDLLAEFRRATRHYVRWRGGLDFAVLCEVRIDVVQVIAEGASDKAILRGLNRLPGVHTDMSGKQTSDINVQKQIWREMAENIFHKWKNFNEVVATTRQGSNISVCFDLRYGAIFAEMIEEPSEGDGGLDVGLFLFAASLNQHEVTNLAAARHFAMLGEAIRHIRTGITKG